MHIECVQAIRLFVVLDPKPPVELYLATPPVDVGMIGIEGVVETDGASAIHRSMRDVGCDGNFG